MLQNVTESSLVAVFLYPLHSYFRSIMPTPLVWCYVPNSDLTGWNLPYVCEDECPTMADAHHHASILRKHYPGHLFVATNGRQPLPTH